MSEEVQTETAEVVVQTENAGIDQVDTAAPEAEVTPEVAKTFTQEELDSIVQKRLAKESRKLAKQAELEAENKVLRAQLQPKQEVAKQADAPRVDDFETYEDYLDARADYIAERKFESKIAEHAQRVQAQSTQAYQAKINETWGEKVTAARDKYSDFDEVIESAEQPITPVIAHALKVSAIGGDIGYYLAKNPSEMDRLAKLDPFTTAIEIGKLEAKLSHTPPKTEVSKAPEPITPMGGKSETKKDPANMTDAEFRDWRRRQIAQRH